MCEIPSQTVLYMTENDRIKLIFKVRMNERPVDDFLDKSVTNVIT